ncbi:MAG: hypothetical protein GWN00_07465, partial [Aliifodinibius sp.]|nr:hypothetical protein [candidate division Zixibacteria bacterium]NIT56070.1 hypothetical protein [Fodinibius sp.]NIS45264.1 hypothetical protein [candidate division Zixibacteria bacterium]NIU13404.1 hypothetical protein [candidate division Zixibacteria bacterium]NIV05414.1 hypothetical protein [candidate division Zixibacteria bacterium]
LNCDSDIFNPGDPPVIESLRTANDVYEVNPGDTVTIVVVATNPEEGPLTYRWTATAGEMLLPSDRDTVHWVAPVNGGRYKIEVEVSNLKDKSSEDEVEIEVISQTAPFVQITFPTEGAFLVQFSNIIVSASAFHANGLQSVGLVINDSLITTQGPNAGGNTYQFNYRLDLPAGQNELKVEAVANITGNTGSDEITINVEGILPKE